MSTCRPTQQIPTKPPTLKNEQLMTTGPRWASSFLRMRSSLKTDKWVQTRFRHTSGEYFRLMSSSVWNVRYTSENGYRSITNKTYNNTYIREPKNIHAEENVVRVLGDKSKYLSSRVLILKSFRKKLETFCTFIII